MSSKSHKHDTLKASIGAGVIASVAKQPFDTQQFGGFAGKIEKFTGSRNVANIARRTPISVLSSVATYGIYDALKKNRSKSEGKKKVDIAKIAIPAVGAAATLPIVLQTHKFPKEIEKLKLPKMKLTGLSIRNRAIQTALAAPLGLYTYGKAKGKREGLGSHITAGVVSGAVGTASTAYHTAKYEALDSKTETAAKKLGKKFETKIPYLKKPTKHGATLGHQLGRTAKILRKKLPGGVVSFGAGIVGYNLIKKHLDKTNK